MRLLARSVRPQQVLTSIQHDSLSFGPLSQRIYGGERPSSVALLILLAEGQPGDSDALNALHHIRPTVRSMVQNCCSLPPPTLAFSFNWALSCSECHLS